MVLTAMMLSVSLTLLHCRTGLTMVSQIIVCSTRRSFNLKTDACESWRDSNLQICGPCHHAIVVDIILGVQSHHLLFQQFLYHNSASQLSTLSLSGPNGFGP